MPDIASITLPSNSTYNFKDNQAIADITSDGFSFIATRRDGTTFNFSQQQQQQQQYDIDDTTVGSASEWSAGTLPTLGTAISADDITA